MKQFALFVALSAASFAWAGQASASQLLFSVTGDVTASFVLHQPPTPSSESMFAFAIQPVAVSYNGSTLTSEASFASAPYGGFALYTTPSTDNPSGYLIENLTGAQLFTGTLDHPTFILGSFAFPNTTYLTSGGTLATGATNLRISNVAGAVPEPSTWVLTIFGFGLIGGTMRSMSRRRRLAVSFA